MATEEREWGVVANNRVKIVQVIYMEAYQLAQHCSTASDLAAFTAVKDLFAVKNYKRSNMPAHIWVAYNLPISRSWQLHQRRVSCHFCKFLNLQIELSMPHLCLAAKCNAKSKCDQYLH